MATKRQARNSRFQRGSANYTCEGCKKSTRETGHGESDCGLCVVCFYVSSLGNSLSDNFNFKAVFTDVDPWLYMEQGNCKTVEEVEARYEAAVEKLTEAGAAY